MFSNKTIYVGFYPYSFLCFAGVMNKLAAAALRRDKCRAGNP
jgi:hypothetical protein